MDYFLDSVMSDAKSKTTLKIDEDLNKLDKWEMVKGYNDTVFSRNLAINR